MSTPPSAPEEASAILRGRVRIRHVGEQRGAADARARLAGRRVVGGTIEDTPRARLPPRGCSRRGLADAARGAGDQRDLAVERAHVGVAGRRPWRSW